MKFRASVLVSSLLAAAILAVAPAARADSTDAAGTSGDTTTAAPAAPTTVKKSSHARKHASTKRAKSRRHAAAVPAVPSFGQSQGLHGTSDPLALKSSVALVLDQDTSEVLLAKNPQAVLPIASLTKLMTALLVVEANQPLDETLEITAADVDHEKHSSSRLPVGTRLTRGELLHLALMASENRAASALGRNYPGGLDVFVQAMNRKAASLGMTETSYVEPTGLSSHNQSSAHDLAILVKAAYQYPLLRELSTSEEYEVNVGRRQVPFRNTNLLVRNPSWDIGLQKTGYIVEAGRCMVMQASLAGRKLIMVLLDSAGKYSRLGDAERIRRWIEAGRARRAPAAEPAPAAADTTPSPVS